MAKPFVKWAGGKTQLLPVIRKKYPEKVKKYCEPFVGGGAVLFDVIQTFHPDEILINDINPELMNLYSCVKQNSEDLLDALLNLQTKYQEATALGQKAMFLEKRERYNFLIENSISGIEKAALLIFLNKTCFNGLYRVNSKGLFNVPFNGAKKPLICDEKNIKECSFSLRNVDIKVGDYSCCADFIDSETFVYFDPPYRPITKSAYFTSYDKNGFDDEQQIRLSTFIKGMAEKNAKILTTNSDPKNRDENDNFFDDLYSSLKIQRVCATRMINCNSSGRGQITELLMSNNKKEDYIPVWDCLAKSFENLGKIEKIAVSAIRIDPSRFDFVNPISKSMVDTIITKFNILAWEPIAVDDEFFLRDGQHRLAAAKKMGLDFVDVVVLNDECLAYSRYNREYYAKRAGIKIKPIKKTRNKKIVL